jgi:hypothetical protein
MAPGIPAGLRDLDFGKRYAVPQTCTHAFGKITFAGLRIHPMGYKAWRPFTYLDLLAYKSLAPTILCFPHFDRQFSLHRATGRFHQSDAQLSLQILTLTMTTAPDMATKDDAVTSDHLEVLGSQPARKGSIDRPTHGKKPVWEEGRTYGPPGKILPTEKR